MKMKKLLSIAIALVLAVGMLAGCGQNGGSGAAENFSETDEKLTLTWLGYTSNPGSEEGTAAELLLEEKFNVDIKPMYWEETSFQDKKTMLMAGGEIPDLVYELDPLHVYNDVDQDFIVEVPYETIEKYAPDYYKYINEYVPAAWIYSRRDGANWGVPNFNHSHDNNQIAVYRKDWLDKFELDTPKTLDEMHEALYKFSNEDPDGNGKKDTFGISIPAQHYHLYFPEIFSAYGVMPFDWTEKDGKIIYGGLLDETKEALKTLATWYEEKIVHPDFITGVAIDDLFKSGQLGYISDSGFYDMSDPTALPTVVKENNPGAEIVKTVLPTGPNGDAGKRAWGRACHVVSFGNTEGYGVKVPRMLQMFNAMHVDEELAAAVRLGKEGTDYKVDPASAGAAAVSYLGKYESADVRQKDVIAGHMTGPTFFAPIPPTAEVANKYNSDAWNEFAAEFIDPKYNAVSIFMKRDVIPSSVDYLLDLTNKQMSLMNKIITGEVGIDAYAEFVDAWNNGGGKIMTEEANQLYDEMEAMYKELGIKN